MIIMHKYKKLLLTLLSALLVFSAATAKPVDPTVAARTAAELLHKKVVDATPATFTDCYLFVGTDGHGFALVASDDCVPPILGYSLNGVFPTDKPLPHHIDTWLKAYQFDIATAKKASASSSPKYNTSRDTAVAPLLTTTWNQAPWYNFQCPYSTDEQAYSVTGCVATATAQVMKYWNHPTVGRGSHSYNASGFGSQTACFDTTHYDWGHMPNALGYNSSNIEINAVAKLMYHIGVAVEMSYSPHSSGAHVSAGGDPNKASSENALKNYFRYNQGLFTAVRDDYTNAQWDSLLTAEINASRPILFSGQDNDGGHAFVIDGYDCQGLYHVNWGWGGYCDGYYTFDNLSPTGSGIGGNPSNSYSYRNQILVHVFPASEASTVTVNVVSADTLRGIITGSGTFSPYASNIVEAIATEGNIFHSWASGNHNNPLYLSPNHDFSDTAYFIPLQGDTLGYCQDGFRDLWGEYNGTPPEWAIRIPATAIAPHRQLNSVEFYGVPEATYSIKAFLGNNFDRMVFSTSRTSSMWGWITVSLPESVPLVDNQPLWIYLTCRSYTNPAAVSSWSGNPDGAWYKRAGTTWEHLEDRNQYASWMIRAVLGELEQVSIDVQSSNPERGTVTGSGLYYPGDTAVITASPASGYRFVAWSNGERQNPLNLRVSAPETIVATFLPNVAIEDIDNPKMRIETSGLTITVENPDGDTFALYDLSGRKLASSRLSSFTYQFTIPGVYLLRCGTHTEKIVIIK